MAVPPKDDRAFREALYRVFMEGSASPAPYRGLSSYEAHLRHQTTVVVPLGTAPISSPPTAVAIGGAPTAMDKLGDAKTLSEAEKAWETYLQKQPAKQPAGVATDKKVEWEKLRAHLSLPRYDEVLVNVATPLPKYELDQFRLEFDLSFKVQAFVDSPLGEAMCDLEDLAVKVIVDENHPLFKWYANKAAEHPPEKAQAKGIVNNVINILTLSRQIEANLLFPTFAIEEYQKRMRLAEDSKKDDERRKNAGLKADMEKIKAALEKLLVTGNRLLKTLFLRVDWIRKSLASEGKPFDVAICLRILAADREWQQEIIDLYKQANSTMQQAYKHEDLLSAFIHYTRTHRVPWPHSESLLKEITGPQPTDRQPQNAEAKSAQDKKQNSERYAFRPMVLNRDRVSCDVCGIQMMDLYPWQKRKLNRVHDKVHQHPYFEEMLGKGFKPLYLALVWDEKKPRPNCFSALDIISDPKFDPDEIIDPINGRTALHCLAHFGNVLVPGIKKGIIGMLLEGSANRLTGKTIRKRASKNSIDKKGFTPRQIAEQRGFKPLYLALVWDRDLKKVSEIINGVDFDPNEIIDPVLNRTALHWLIELGMELHVHLPTKLEILAKKPLKREVTDIKGKSLYDTLKEGIYYYTDPDVRQRLLDFFNPAVHPLFDGSASPEISAQFPSATISERSEAASPRR